MNKYLRAFGILSILCFSFYCTEQTALFMQKQDPIYESIIAVFSDYEEKAVDASISDTYIIPGYAGIQVDIDESFRNMKYLGAFHTKELVFEEILPEISILQNKTKIIKQGNPLKQAVSIILTDELLIHYLEELGIPYAVLTTKSNANTHRAYGEKINYDFTSYQEVESILNSLKENKNFCLVSNEKYDFCKSKNKVLIEETKIITKNNFAEEYKKISSGDILLLQNNLGLANLKILLEQVRFKGLDVVSLENLISESR